MRPPANYTGDARCHISADAKYVACFGYFPHEGIWTIYRLDAATRPISDAAMKKHEAQLWISRGYKGINSKEVTRISGPEQGLHMAPSDDWTQFVKAWDKTIQLGRIGGKSGKKKWKVDGDAHIVGVDFSGDYIAALQSDGTVTVWRVSSINNIQRVWRSPLSRP